MATSYGTILKEAGVRVNALVGATPATLEATYAAAITSASFDSAEFPFTLFKDTCLAVESKLATAIASTGNHPWRRILESQTANIAHEAVIPSIDSGSNQIIGIYGAVVDYEDGTVCSEMSMDDIRISVRNANSWRVTDIYGYKIDGGRIFHTRTNVKIDVCTYNRTTQATAIATLTNPILLPDALESAYVAGMVSLLVRDDAFIQQAQVYSGYFADALNSIAQGLTSVASKSIPSPTLIAA